MFEKSVRKTQVIVDSTETYSGEIMGYSVLISKDKHGSVLSIYSAADIPRVNMGIIRCNPANVAELEVFGSLASQLFSAIAQELRMIGQDDLRGDCEKEYAARIDAYRTNNSEPE